MKKLFNALDELTKIIGKVVLMLVVLVGILFSLKYINNHVKKIPFVDKYLNSVTMDKDLAYPLGY